MASLMERNHRVFDQVKRNRMATEHYFYKCKPMNFGNGFIAWAALEQMIGDCVLDEPAEPVYFEFGETPDEAIEMLKEEVTDAHGPREWIKQ